ncbi:MAG: hypothetical protein QOF32_818 [Gammaproteobacteria bacterium]|jgi:uncharacterized protein involved in exopolysaccharide biosynthesis|nr:hypothetical protein [Gammaproteobacteria bacterium]
MHANDQMDRDEAISLIDLWFILWQSKRILIVTAAISIGLALVYALTAQLWYRAEVLLKLADSKQSQGLLGGLGGLGGLASLAGLDVNDNKSAEPLGVLKSREFAGAFIEDLDLLPVFFARKWDASAKRWKPPNIDDQPDVRDGIEYFHDHVLKIQEDKKTGLITMTVDWTDAKVAADWANLLVERVNDRMRQRALTAGELNMTFLKQEVAASNVVALQQSIGRVLEAELQKLILAKANKEYAFRIIDHAQVPKRRDHPHRALIVIGAFFFGTAMSALFVISRHVVRRNRAMRAGTQASKSPSG